MTQDEMRRLLGGYATNALSADERRMLFEAALEDQDLFNALNDEDALRELLEDPVLRDQVRTALRTAPASMAHGAKFAWRRWMAGVVVPAMVALIVIAVMYRPQTRRPAEPAPQSHVPLAQNVAPPAPNEIASMPKTEPPAVKKQSARIQARSRESAIPAPAPARVIAPQVAEAEALEKRPTLAAPAITTFGANGPSIPDAVRRELSSKLAPALIAIAPPYLGPLVRHSLVRSGLNGDEIRVEVSAQTAGYLALYEISASGNPMRVYPENDVATPIAPNVTMQIPAAPIKVGAGTKLRLVVLPRESSITGAIGGVPTSIGTGAAPAPRAADSLQPSATPLVIDIPLVPF